MASKNNTLTVPPVPANNTCILKTPTLALFIARRNSGKSYLMRHLLHVLSKGKKFDWIYVISPTSFNGEWSDIVGKKNVTDTFNAVWLERLMNAQAASIGKGRGSSGLIIMDDCLGSANFQEDIFTKLAIAGRHFKITVWATFQHYFKVPTVLRSNCDYMFILGNQQQKVVKALYEEYAPPDYDTYQELNTKFRSCTEDHGALLIDNTSGAASLHRVRAPSNPIKFKITSK